MMIGEIFDKMVTAKYNTSYYSGYYEGYSRVMERVLELSSLGKSPEEILEILKTIEEPSLRKQEIE